MKPRHPIRPHAASRGGLRIGDWLAALPASGSLTAHRAGSRFGGLPVPNH